MARFTPLCSPEQHEEAGGPAGDTKPNSALRPPEAHSHTDREACTAAENTLLYIPQERKKVERNLSISEVSAIS